MLLKRKKNIFWFFGPDKDWPCSTTILYISYEIFRSWSV